VLVLRRSSGGHEQRAREHHQQVAGARHPARAGARRRGAAAAAAAARRHVGVGGCGRREGADEAAAGGVARARPRGPRPRPRQDGQGDAPAALGTQVKRRRHVLSPHRGLVAAAFASISAAGVSGDPAAGRTDCTYTTAAVPY